MFDNTVTHSSRQGQEATSGPMTFKVGSAAHMWAFQKVDRQLWEWCGYRHLLHNRPHNQKAGIHVGPGKIEHRQVITLRVSEPAGSSAQPCWS